MINDAVSRKALGKSVLLAGRGNPVGNRPSPCRHWRVLRILEEGHEINNHLIIGLLVEQI